MTRTPVTLLLACCAVTAPAISACGGSDKLEGKAMRGIETGIKQRLAKQKDVLSVTVQCPKSAERKKGVVFTCRIQGLTKFGRAKATAIVTETDDRGSVHYIVPKQ